MCGVIGNVLHVCGVIGEVLHVCGVIGEVLHVCGVVDTFCKVIIHCPYRERRLQS